MSQLKVDDIVDAAGTGAPGFSNGIKVTQTTATGADSNTTLTSASARWQIVTPTASRDYTLPADSKQGDEWQFTNQSADQELVIKADDGATVTTVAAASTVKVSALINNAATNTDWLELSFGGGTSGVIVDAQETIVVTVANNGTKAFTASAVGRRVGDTLELSFRLQSNTTAAGAGGSNFNLVMPAGLTIDATKLPSGIGSYIGPANTYGVSAASQYDNDVGIYTETTTTLRFAKPATGAYYTTSDLNNTNLQVFGGTVLLPIAEWAGSGTSGVSAARVEYAFNSSTANSSDSTSFGYGPGGVDFGSYTGVTTDKTVRFQTPIQPSDFIALEYSPDAGQTWTSGPGYNGVLQDAELQNGVLYGWRLDNVAASTTDVKVIFYNYRLSNGATYGAAGATWAGAAGGNNRWRVRKSSPNAPAGIQLATDTVPGLVTANRYTTKSVVAPANGDTSLSFSNLIVGKIYKVSIGIEGDNNTQLGGARRTHLQVTHDSNIIARVGFHDWNDTGTFYARATRIFTATATTLAVLVTETNTTFLEGHSILEELNNYTDGGF